MREVPSQQGFENAHHIVSLSLSAALFIALLTILWHTDSMRICVSASVWVFTAWGFKKKREGLSQSFRWRTTDSIAGSLRLSLHVWMWGMDWLNDRRQKKEQRKCLVSPGRKGMMRFLGSFCPPSIGNLSRSCIWGRKTTEIKFENESEMNISK